MKPIAATALQTDACALAAQVGQLERRQLPGVERRRLDAGGDDAETQIDGVAPERQRVDVTAKRSTLFGLRHPDAK